MPKFGWWTVRPLIELDDLVIILPMLALTPWRSSPPLSNALTLISPIPHLLKSIQLLIKTRHVSEYQLSSLRMLMDSFSLPTNIWGINPIPPRHNYWDTSSGIIGLFIYRVCWFIGLFGILAMDYAALGFVWVLINFTESSLIELH
jgi:hypothetical protein